MIWNDFSFQILFMKQVVFYIPKPFVRGYKSHNEFHKYCLEWKLISDSFYRKLNSQKPEKNQVFLPILLGKTPQRQDVTYDIIDELRRLGLSKCFPALCRKTCDKIN